MKIAWLALLVAAVAVNRAPPLTSAQPGDSGGQDIKVVSHLQDGREEILTALRQRAKVRIDAEALAFSAAELAEIEARYRSAFRPEVLDGRAFLRRPGAEPILVALVRRYPRANRAGCALLLLAQLSTGARREYYLREAIRFRGDAWFENGVQVGALARAMLAIHLAGLERFDEAEGVAAELVRDFPGAIDQTGASLDDTLTAIKQLRPRRQAAAEQPANGRCNRRAARARRAETAAAVSAARG